MISILIPARNEKYLQKTVQDIRDHAETDVEILVGLDGYKDNLEGADLVFRVEQSVGQRAMTNILASKANGDLLMKVDAHCSFSQGFDRAMLDDYEPDMILAPALMNLNAEIWEIRAKPVCSRYCFGTDMIFSYDEELPGLLIETMCLQGSAWLVSREKFFELNLSGEEFGSWGQQGVELGCKAWLNNMRCMTTKKAYYGHMFRTEFPYEQSKEQIDNAREKSRQFLSHPKFQWYIEKFGYPKDWTKDVVNNLPLTHK